MAGRRESRIKTRFLIISDTHSADPSEAASGDGFPFRPPLPQADVLMHCGDLTMVGLLREYEKTLEMLKSIPASLKLVIAGNHDISLDQAYFERKGEYMQRRYGYDKDLPRKAKELWTGEQAQAAGVTYLDEGMHTFTLSNGARLCVCCKEEKEKSTLADNSKIYTSPYQPEFCDWAFPYERIQDRFNPPHQCTPGAIPIAENPVPDFPGIDVMMTHGPPYGIQDATTSGQHVGCEHLLRAARRCKPRMYCFGHIHEAWGAQRVEWEDGEEIDVSKEKHVKKAESIVTSHEKMSRERAATIDVSQSSDRPLEYGKETLMINASIMSIIYRPSQGPWLVDLDLDSA